MSHPSLPSMRLVIFAMYPSTVADALIEAFEKLGQQVLLLVTAPPIHGKGSSAHASHHSSAAFPRRKFNILIASRKDQLPAMLKGLAPDLIFTVGFPWRFPPELLAVPRLGCVNVHTSLLPKYRGPRPLFWQFFNGETQTGVTIHRMEPDFDTGPILAQRSLDVAPDDDAFNIWRKLVPLEVSMLPEVLTAVAAGVEGRPQSTAEASYNSFPTEAERRLDWTYPAMHLHNRIRSWGSQGALAEVDGRTVVVQGARVVSPSPAMASTLPGTVLSSSPQEMLVQTSQDALLITKYAYVDQA